MTLASEPRTGVGLVGVQTCHEAAPAGIDATIIVSTPNAVNHLRGFRIYATDRPSGPRRKGCAKGSRLASFGKGAAGSDGVVGMLPSVESPGEVGHIARILVEVV
jgi:hypothetical protein